jgi:alkylation response protein AidB-like acyl-CoA dehydrogenase
VTVRPIAQLDGDHYVINGQKTWASRGAFADWLFGIFRTDPDSQRHRGLTFVLVPLDTPGVKVRPIAQLDGETGFAEVFFDDARVPAANRLGDTNQGWKVAMATAGFERGLMLRSPARFQATAARLVELYKRHAAAADPCLRDAVIRAWTSAEAYCLNTYQTASRLIAGGSIGAEASLNKIFWSEMDVHMHETALALLGARAQLLRHAPAAGDVGNGLEGYLFSLAGPIYLVGQEHEVFDESVASQSEDPLNVHRVPSASQNDSRLGKIEIDRASRLTVRPKHAGQCVELTQ